jgi:hypothetical protein
MNVLSTWAVTSGNPADTGEAAPVGTRRRLSATGWCVGGLAAAALLLIASLRTIDPGTLDGRGLAAALPVAVWVALGLIVVVFVAALVTRAHHGVLAAATLASAGVIYGLQSVVYPIGRGPIAWLHWGMVDQIALHGAVIPHYDIRFSWPGFFAGMALVARAAGINDPNGIIRWAPLALGLLETLSVRVLAAEVLGDRRTAWTAAFLFTAAESIGQNYFSPQGITFPAVVLVLALVCRFGLRRPLTGAEPPARGYGWMLVLFIVVCAMLAPSHQLSPLFLIIFLGVLTLQRRLRHWWLPAVPLVLVLAWWATGGREFWTAHSDLVTGQIGQVSSSVASTFLNRFAGGQARQLLIFMHVAAAGATMALAVVGFLVLRHQRVPARWTLAAWTVLPFGMVAAQSYGGEMLLRSFLFALPAASILGAGVVLAMLDATRSRLTVRTAGARTAGGRTPGARRPGARSARARRAWFVTAVGVVTVGLGVLAASTVATRGQDDAFNAFSPLDRQASVASLALPGPVRTVAGLTSYLPARDREILAVKQYSLAAVCAVPDSTVGCVLDQAPDRIVFGPAQDGWGRVMGNLPAGWTTGVATALVQTGEYRVAWHVGDAWVLEHVTPPPSPAPPAVAPPAVAPPAVAPKAP